MKPMMKSPWVTLEKRTAGFLGAEDMMREGQLKSKAQRQSGEGHTRRCPLKLTDLLSRWDSCPSEPWVTFQRWITAQKSPRRLARAAEPRLNKDDWSITGTYTPRATNTQALCKVLTLASAQQGPWAVLTSGRYTKNLFLSSFPLNYSGIDSLKWLIHILCSWKNLKVPMST